MFYKKLKYSLLSLLFITLPISAQLVETKTGVDTLTFAERISVKTNAVNWLILTPNISVEYDLKGTNWSRWAVQLSLKSTLGQALQNTHSYAPPIVYNRFQARAEVRQYYRYHSLDCQVFTPHRTLWGKALSTRRLDVKHPNTTYFRGAYVAYDNFSAMMFLLANKGIQGHAYSGGFTYGIVKPLARFTNGNSLDLELSASAGVAYVQYKKYKYDRETYEYVTYGDDVKGFRPALGDLNVGFTYRFGNYPLYKKYRYRYDVDMEYNDRLNNEALERSNYLSNKTLHEQRIEDMEDMFWSKYRILTGEKRINRHRNRADRRGENADLASATFVAAQNRMEFRDSLNTAVRFEDRAFRDSLAGDECRRITVFDITGVDIKKNLSLKRKFEKMVMDARRESSIKRASMADKIASEQMKTVAIEDADLRRERDAVKKHLEQQEKEELRDIKEAEKEAERKAQEKIEEGKAAIKMAEAERKAEAKRLEREQEEDRKRAEEKARAETKLAIEKSKQATLTEEEELKIAIEQAKIEQIEKRQEGEAARKKNEAARQTEQEAREAKRKADQETKAADRKAEEEAKAARKKAAEEKKAEAKKAEQEAKAARKKADAEMKAELKKAEDEAKKATEEAREAAKKAVQERKKAAQDAKNAAKNSNK